jgi:D-glycero-alpha-D-manno-heptose 1-phosphate guanylyltransferase
MEAIVLAGGRGTRLASVIHDLPKVMAPIHGRPFLEFLLHRLRLNGIHRVILSVGYLAECVHDHFGEKFEGLELAYSVEQKPLGTGGAVRKALKMANSDALCVMNGDTFADLDFSRMLANHIRMGAEVSLAVVEVSDCARYGNVLIEDGRVTEFQEKGRVGPGLISLGAYVLNRDVFAPYDLPDVFSIEMDFFVPHLNTIRPLAFVTSGYFIDIGVPEDFVRAQHELL